MMTLSFGLIAASSFLLWRDKAQWGWAMVMAALVIGVVIFVQDVDFATNLGIQF